MNLVSAFWRMCIKEKSSQMTEKKSVKIRKIRVIRVLKND
jgi:hypothetical protein